MLYFCQSVVAENVTDYIERTHLGVLISAKLRTAMLLLLGLLGRANSTLLVSSINTLPTCVQVNSSLLFCYKLLSLDRFQMAFIFLNAI